jgi:tetratricopeptide (TPR) repeat protein
MRALFLIFPLLLTAFLNAQKVEPDLPTEVVAAEIVEAAEAPELESVTVPVEMVNQSWFTDRTGTAVIHFDEVVELPEALPSNVKGVSFINVDVRETPDSDSGKSAAVVRFVLRDTGVVTFPMLEFVSESKQYRTIPQQLAVGAVVCSDAMSLKLSPAKRTIYVGEPLRVDLTWQCDLDASRLQALNYYPAFFNDPAVEIVIPRSTEAEKQQVGLPIGGRRVIAKRTILEGKAKALGAVTLPLYLRLSEPGAYTLPATRLECAYLKQGSRNFGQYAAHFNNSLFAPEDSDVRYERFYVETDAIEIEVLPLPAEGRSSSFSGLFAPVRMEVSLAPEALKVGELMQAELQVFTDAPHGMIELPKLSQQRGLRGRFLVDDDLGRTWRADGTTFRCRLRALTTGVDAFPALQIQAFDAEAGDYVMVATEPVALSVAPNEGQDYIDLKSYKGAGVTLSKQSVGIWHNRKANRMNDLINTIVVCLASWFWLWLFLAVVGFLLMLPIVRERRRRSIDAKYGARVEAYAAFSKLAESDPAKWPAFLQFLAVSFDAEGKAWTVRNSEAALQALGLSSEDIESVIALHRASDAQDYSVQHPNAQLSALNGVGKRILGLLGKAALLALLGISVVPQTSEASDWSEAEALFEQALIAQAGSNEAAALYAESALKFQAVAEAGERPGMAWYNAGNAWFQTGALGRSIAAYRQARIYRPFDSMLTENLDAARALALNDVPEDFSWWQQWPTVWLKVVLLLLIVIFGVCVLGTVRYRQRIGGIACLTMLLLCCLTAGLWIVTAQLSGRQGVVIVDSVLARKGPSYAYTAAFHEPLHDGVELTVHEIRKEWGLVSLVDERECWVPLRQIQLIY